MAYHSKYTGLQIDDILDSVEYKQSKIEDLASIRAGAQKGATALQSYTEKYTGTVTGIKINGVVKSGSGVIDLGTIESKTLTESDIAAMGFTKNTGTYSKPSGGIPKSDLASAVQTSLGKADTALQSYTEQYKGTVTGVKINGTTKNPSSGVVDLGTVITAHQTLKTINGESIVGNGDITINGGSSDANVQAVDTGDVLDDVTVNYATKTYVDGIVGNINSVLESIINGSASPTIITFNLGGKEYQAEEGMTFYDWGMSKYYDSSINLIASLSDSTFNESCQNFGNTSTYCYAKGGMSYTPTILLNSVIQPITYAIVEPT